MQRAAVAVRFIVGGATLGHVPRERYPLTRRSDARHLGERQADQLRHRFPDHVGRVEELALDPAPPLLARCAQELNEPVVELLAIGGYRIGSHGDLRFRKTADEAMAGCAAAQARDVAAERSICRYS